jgi:LysM repeat protein
MTIRRVLILLAVASLLLAALPGASVGAASQATYYACAAYHQVMPGENLYRISLRYNVSQAAIMAANGIANPDLIYAGQSLCIPGSTPPPPYTPPPYTRPPCGIYYTVQYGDTLSSIAARHGVTMQSIMYANNILNPNYIYAGMILYVPCSTTKPPTPGTSYPQWKGEYFNNMDLAGAPSLVRNDFSIAFNWGVGWPNPRISADHFSVRWTRTFNLSQGTYRFSVSVDDGTRLFVDNVPVVDEWHAATGQTYIVDVPLGAGNHVIRMEYYEDTGNAFAYLTYGLVSSTVPPVATPLPGVSPTPGPTGSAWTCTFYGNQDLDDARATVTVPVLNFNWGGESPYPGVPKNLWSMRCTSVQYFPSSGLYQFNAQVDDGVRVFVDGNAVISAWTNHAGTTEVGTASLSAGPHGVTVEYYQFGHDSLLAVWWNKK